MPLFVAVNAVGALPDFLALTEGMDYQNLLNRRAEQSEGRAVVRFSADARRVEESANKEVQREPVVNFVAEVNDRAVELADRNDAPAAAQALREQRAVLEKLADQATSRPATREDRGRPRRAPRDPRRARRGVPISAAGVSGGATPGDSQRRRRRLDAELPFG